MSTRPDTLAPTSGLLGWQRLSKAPEFPKSALEWLDSGKEPTHQQILEALALAMARCGKDLWDMDEDVMPPAVPSEVLKWLKLAPPWPAYRPAREAWLTACILKFVPDSVGWTGGGKNASKIPG